MVDIFWRRESWWEMASMEAVRAVVEVGVGGVVRCCSIMVETGTYQLLW